jgi:hypothetical protein
MSIGKVARTIFSNFTWLLALATPFVMFVVFVMTSLGYQDHIAYHVRLWELLTLLPLIIVGLIWIPILISEKRAKKP